MTHQPRRWQLTLTPPSDGRRKRAPKRAEKPIVIEIGVGITKAAAVAEAKVKLRSCPPGSTAELTTRDPEKRRGPKSVAWRASLADRGRVEIEATG